MLAVGVAALATGGALFSDKTPRAAAARPTQQAQSSNAGQPGVGDDQPLSAAVLQQIAALQAEKRSRTPEQQKIDSQLLYALKLRQNDPALASVPALEVGAQVSAAGRTVVDITAEVSDSLLDRLRGGGATIIDSVPQYRSVRADISIDSLEAIAGLPEVIFIQPEQQGYVWRNEQKAQERLTQIEKGLVTRPGFAARAARVRAKVASALRGQSDEENTPGTNTGSVNSEGDRAHEADRARGTFNVNGSGVKIGVMSDGVRGIAEAQQRGDLPPNVIILPGQTGPPEGGEGTAMLEIVHDLAPGAQLYFATAFGGTARFAQNIHDLRTAGCDIIVDDVFYSFETPFQDGQAPTIVSPTNGAIVAQAVIDVTNGGAEYFSSAGNGGNKNDNTAGVWEGDFFDGGPAPAAVGGPTAGQVHDFNGAAAGGTFNTITAASGAQIVLFWSDPLGGSSNDYDLFVTDSSGALVAFSANPQSGTQDPLEAIAASANVVGNRIIIVRYDRGDVTPVPGPPSASRFLHLTTTPNGGGAKLTFNTAGQTKGHNTAAKAYGVGATPAFVPYPNPFNSSNVVETFSSDGPRRLFFNADGTPKTPGNFSSTGGEVRQKPDITAADGVMVTGAGGFPPGSAAPFRFFGTSAAAPHAAAIAGLVKSANLAITQAQMRTAINASAVDIEAPGVDRDSGVGIIMAFGALQASGATGFADLEAGATSATEIAGGNGNGFVEPGERGSLTVQLRNLGVAPATGINATLSSTTPGVVVAPPATSAYPDIAPGAAANNTTPFEFLITAGAGCNTTITFNLTVNYTGGPSPKVIPITLFTGPQANVTTSLNATPPPANAPYYTAVTGTQTNRIARTADVSSCANNKANPGPTAVAGALRYDAYTFQNTSTTATCVTINFTSTGGGNIQVVAYSPSFNPANPGNNFLGDYGNLITTNRNFSVNLPAGQNLVVVVNEASAGGCPSCTYSLQVTGIKPPCAAATAFAPGTLQFSAPTYSTGEGDGTGTVTVTRTGGSDGTSTVSYTVSNGTATNGADYTGAGSGTLTFAPGETSKNIVIPILEDALDEADETVNFSLDSVTSGFATLGAQKTAVLTIVDNDAAPSLSINDVTVNEGNSGTTNASFTVTLSAASGQAVTVNATTADGTAVAPSDYQAVSTTLTFAPGETSKTVNVPVNGDANGEFDENFFVNLSGAVNATVADAQGIGTIRDEDPATTVQFADPTYTVVEDGTLLNVTVTRSGDTSTAVSVRYTTVNGTASDRSDYDAAAGTLTFAAGETGAVIPVLINEDSLVEGPEAFTLTLSSPQGIDVALGGQSTTTVNIVDDMTEPATNAIDDSTNFVRQHYHDFLNREPDDAGLAFWVNGIESCGADAGCREVKRIDTSAAFFLSIEFQRTGFFVYRSFAAAFGPTRVGSTVPLTFQEFLPDTQQIGRGVVIGRPGAEALLESNKQAYMLEFVQRPGFTAQYPASMTPAQFVDALNANTGNSLTTAQRDALVAQLSANNTTQGRADVLRQVVENDAFQAREFNRAFVLMQYFGYLRRNPNDPPDTNFSGYNFWLAKLNSFNGDFRKAELVKAFISSAEYRSRFGTN